MNLKELRIDTGVKLIKLAETLELSRQQYSNMEKGKGKMNAGRIEKLSKKFNVEPLIILKAWEETKSNGKRC